jgi:hypothetical protein
MNQYETYAQINYTNDISKYRTRNLPPKKNDQIGMNDDLTNKPKAYNWLQMLYHKLIGKRSNNNQ